MSELTIILIIFFIAIMGGRILYIPYQIRIYKQIANIKKQGYVSSVGTYKDLLGLYVGVLVCDKLGNIESAYRIKSRLINGKLTLDKNFEYKNYKDIILTTNESNNKMNRQAKAYLSAAMFLEKGFSDMEAS